MATPQKKADQDPRVSTIKAPKQVFGNDLIPRPIVLIKDSLSFIPQLTVSVPLLSSPLQVAKVDRTSRQCEQRYRYQHGCSCENNVHDDDVFVAVVVGVPDGTGDDTNDDIHTTNS